ncbi:MAG: hypothetical protein WBJ41_10360, partial [Chromatiaceae bacterium]
VYNHHLPQRALGHVCPVEALEQWRVKQPELFVSEINNLPGLDKYSLPHSARSSFGYIPEISPGWPLKGAAALT